MLIYRSCVVDFIYMKIVTNHWRILYIWLFDNSSAYKKNATYRNPLDEKDKSYVYLNQDPLIESRYLNFVLAGYMIGRLCYT